MTYRLTLPFLWVRLVRRGLAEDAAKLGPAFWPGLSLFFFLLLLLLSLGLLDARRHAICLAWNGIEVNEVPFPRLDGCEGTTIQDLSTSPNALLPRMRTSRRLSSSGTGFVSPCDTPCFRAVSGHTSWDTIQRLSGASNTEHRLPAVVHETRYLQSNQRCPTRISSTLLRNVVSRASTDARHRPGFSLLSKRVLVFETCVRYLTDKESVMGRMIELESNATV